MSVVERRLDLSGTGLDFEVLPHGRTERALDEATALALPPEEIAKTIVLHVDIKGCPSISPIYARVVLPASEQLDLHKLRIFFAESRAVRLAREEELADAFPEFELGAVPPLGGHDGDIVIVDPRVAGREWAVFEAGTHEASVRMRSADLIAATKAEIVDMCRE